MSYVFATLQLQKATSVCKRSINTSDWLISKRWRDEKEQKRLRSENAWLFKNEKSITEIQESLEQVWLQWILWKNFGLVEQISWYIYVHQSMRKLKLYSVSLSSNWGTVCFSYSDNCLKVIFSLILGILKSKGSNRNHVLIVDIRWTQPY